MSNQISKKRNNETLKYLSNVFITKKPTDDEAFRQFAKMLVKNETSGKSKPVGQAPRKEVSTNAQKLLNDHPVVENSLVNENTEKQISSAQTSRNNDIPNNDAPGKPDSIIADQKVKQKTVKPKKSDKPKRSSKAESKLTKESRQSDGKSKKTSKKSNQRSSSAEKLKKTKKSSKKTKKSKRSTEDDDKQKSKNKLKKKREKPNKN